MKIDEMYVVAGTVDREMKFLSHDSASGGYPYEESYPREITSDLYKALSSLKDANMTRLSNAKIYKLIFEEVDVSHHLSEIKTVETILSNLTPTQRKFLKENL